MQLSAQSCTRVTALLLLFPPSAFAQVEVKTKEHAVTTHPAKSHDFGKWEKAISAYETQDRKKMPPKGGNVFIGSSTIALWKSLPEDYPDHVVINRGFGGSQIVDATYFADRIIFPYEPRMVFLRSGGNDIAAGKSAERVFEDYKAFVAKVHKHLPSATIAFISQSPAPVRWKQRQANKEVNDKVKEFVEEKPYLKYVETYDISLDDKGEVRTELFRADQLHFNDAGYKLLIERVRPFLPKD